MSLNGSFAKGPHVAHMFNHGWWRLAVGGWWQWRLATGGWWRLVVVGGGWWLMIGGWGRQPHAFGGRGPFHLMLYTPPPFQTNPPPPKRGG